MEQSTALVRAASAARDIQYLTFTVGEEEYGVDILRVQEIKGYTAITRLPNSPPSIKGVMNLRGTVVPVIGLREMFGMPSAEYGKFSVIVVMNVGARVVGLLVDTVSDVVSLPLTDVDLATELGGRLDRSFIAGMARSAEKFIIVLAIEKLVGGLDTGSDLIPPASAATGELLDSRSTPP
jgi:purine-binding chemotaxis protein CheW